MPIIDHASVLDEDADHAWDVLRRFGAISDWHPAIAESRIDGGLPDGAPDTPRLLLTYYPLGSRPAETHP